MWKNNKISFGLILELISFGINTKDAILLFVKHMDNNCSHKKKNFILREAEKTWQKLPAAKRSPVQHPCLENSTHRGLWQAMVHGVAESQTEMNNWARAHTHTHTHTVHGVAESQTRTTEHARTHTHIVHGVAESVTNEQLFTRMHTVHGVAKSQTEMNNWARVHTQTHAHTHNCIPFSFHMWTKPQNCWRWHCGWITNYISHPSHPSLNWGDYYVISVCEM